MKQDREYIVQKLRWNTLRTDREGGLRMEAYDRFVPQKDNEVEVASYVSAWAIEAVCCKLMRPIHDVYDFFHTHLRWPVPTAWPTKHRGFLCSLAGSHSNNGFAGEM